MGRRAFDGDTFTSVCWAFHALRALEGEDVSMAAGVRRMGRRKGERRNAHLALLKLMVGCES